MTFFCIGSITVTICYYLIAHWRIVTIITMTIPSIVALALIFFYI